jgi:hypothetical protein
MRNKHSTTEALCAVGFMIADKDYAGSAKQELDFFKKLLLG